MARKRHIAVLLGSLVAWIIGHNVVPHHHHLDDVYSHQGCHSQDGSQFSGITGDPARHCHAFNGMEYIAGQEELTPSVPGKTAGKDLTRTALTDPLLSTRFVFHSGDGGISCLFVGHFGNSPGLRAPPLA